MLKGRKFQVVRADAALIHKPKHVQSQETLQQIRVDEHKVKNGT